MKAEIVAVGTEILLGEISNSNGQYLAQRLAELGIDSYFQTVVGDNPERLTESIEIAANRSDLVITIGGLGPTADDITKQMLSQYLGQPLVQDNDAMDKIIRSHNETGKPMNNNDEIQAQYIKGSTILKNDVGFAVGMLYQNPLGADFMLLPGPPSEFTWMVDHYSLTALNTVYHPDKVIVSRLMRYFGIGESALVNRLKDLIDAQTNPTIAPYAKDYEVTLRISAQATDKQTAQGLVDKMAWQVNNRIGEFYYGDGEGNSLAHVLVQKLTQENMTITAAESLTGGLFQSTLCAVPGASAVFNGGFVTYSNNVKHELLGIPGDVINDYGVVSKEVARQMAERSQQKMGTTMGISFTGVAGPDELEDNPAGTVWIGLSIAGRKTITQLFKFSKTRNAIREQSVMSGLALVIKALK